MFPEYETQIRNEAVGEYPLEACWLITGDGCELVENVHESPETHFSVSKKDIARALSRGLLAVVHSHPDGHAVPSAPDMESQVNSAVPWGVLGSSADGATRISWWGGERRPPLLGRPFKHGVTDCYALIRDYYHIERGIELPEYPRSWMWWDNGQDLFSEGFVKAGFRPISSAEVQVGDVWLAKIRSKVVNHGGIYLGNDLMLHQIGSPSSPIDNSRLSAREPMSRYVPFVTHWLRYEG